MEKWKYVEDRFAHLVGVPGDVRGFRIVVENMLRSYSFEAYEASRTPRKNMSVSFRRSAFLASCAAVMFEVERWTPAVFNTNGGHLLTSHIHFFLL